MSAARIGLALIEAQGVLELVAGRLDTETPLDPDDAYNVFAAVRAAIARLDAAHDALMELEESSAPALVAMPPGVVQ